MTRLCIVRDLNGENDTTAPMACAQAIKVAQSGQWGKNWAIEECLENPDGSAPILKERITFIDRQYAFMTRDDFFLSHFTD